MENISVAKGQVYKLVSGGPWMTVTGVSEHSGQVFFSYFHEGVPHSWTMRLEDVALCLEKRKME